MTPEREPFCIDCHETRPERFYHDPTGKIPTKCRCHACLKLYWIEKQAELRAHRAEARSRTEACA